MFIFTIILPLIVRILFLPIKILLKITIKTAQIMEKRLKKSRKELSKEVSKLKKEQAEASEDKKTLKKEKRELEIENIMLGNSSEKVVKDLSDVDMIQDNIEDSIQSKRIEIAILRTKIIARRALIIMLKLFYKAINLFIHIISWVLSLSAWFITILFVGMTVTAVIFISSGALDFGLVASGTSKPKTEQNDKPQDASGDTDLYVRVLQTTAEYEMNDANPGLVAAPLDDGAGKNYGKYSFTQNYTMDNFRNMLEERYPKLAKELHGETCSEEFDESWRKLGENQAVEFTRAQAYFVITTHVLPQIDYLKEETGLDLNDGTKSLGAVSIFCSLMWQRPAWIDELIIPAVRSMGEYSDDKFIEATGGHIRDNYTGNEAFGVRNRYVHQCEEEKGKTEKIKL